MYASVQFMALKKNAGSIPQFLSQETIRFNDEERAKLDALLRAALERTPGRVMKVDIVKELMGLQRHGLITAQDREALLSASEQQQPITAHRGDKIEVKPKRGRQ